MDTLNTLDEFWQSLVQTFDESNTPQNIAALRFTFFRGAEAVLLLGERTHDMSDDANQQVGEQLLLECRYAFVDFWVARGMSLESVLEQDAERYGEALPERKATHVH